MYDFLYFIEPWSASASFAKLLQLATIPHWNITTLNGCSKEQCSHWFLIELNTTNSI